MKYCIGDSVIDTDTGHEGIISSTDAAGEYPIRIKTTELDSGEPCIRSYASRGSYYAEGEIVLKVQENVLVGAVVTREHFLVWEDKNTIKQVDLRDVTILIKKRVYFESRASLGISPELYTLVKDYLYGSNTI